MTKLRFGIACGGIAVLVASWFGTGCSNAQEDCDRNPILGCGSWTPQGIGGATSSSASANGGAGGSSPSSSSGGGGLPTSCVPSELKSGAVADDCGVFVSESKGNDTHSGLSKTDAVKTLAQAISIAGKSKKRIYACGEMFVEGVTLPAGIELYGALDCAGDWSRGATKTTIRPGGAIAGLTLSKGAGTTHVEDVAVIVGDAGAMGASSIAVLADEVTAQLVNCNLTAGNGGDGAPGTKPPGAGQKGSDAEIGALDGCAGPGVFGGSPGQSTCSGVTTDGGPGGNGTKLTTGAPGTDAPPQPQPNALAGSDGKAGKAQDVTPCNAGDNGANGLSGDMPGIGATGIGDLTATGYKPPLATDGQSIGGPGYGGGGGGGAAVCANLKAGPAGGGGGAGGCGGNPGSAGQSGGSSIGLASVGATLTLSGVKITVAAGGNGGVGGDGQPGGQGGSGGVAGMGDANASACNGGKGGQGGRGASGGGGLGGHSIGIATKGGTITQTSAAITIGAFGVGGIGGDKDMTVGVVGGNGASCKTLAFDTMMCTN